MSHWPRDPLPAGAPPEPKVLDNLKAILERNQWMTAELLRAIAEIDAREIKAIEREEAALEREWHLQQFDLRAGDVSANPSVALEGMRQNSERVFGRRVLK